MRSEPLNLNFTSWLTWNRNLERKEIAKSEKERWKEIFTMHVALVDMEVEKGDDF